MLFTTLDVILLMSDSVGNLLEPVYERIAKRLNFKQHDGRGLLYRADAPWLLRSHSIDRTLGGLHYEMEAFYEMQGRVNNESKRLVAVELARRTIATKWPWASLHCGPTDPVDRQLNWVDHDLCLIDDWDFPMLAPTADWFAPPMGKLSTSSERGKSSMDVVDDDDGDASGRFGPAKWCPMRIIYSSSVDRKLWLELDASHHGSTPSKSCTKPSPNKVTKKGESVSSTEEPEAPKSLLCLKWLTTDEFLRQEARAKLVFYYTQIHPELAPLYQVVSSLLDSAQLIESGSISQADAALLQVDRWSSSLLENYGNPGGNKPAMAAAAGGRQQQQLAPPLGSQLLSRYALVLMLAAYLTSESALKLKRLSGGGKHFLAQHLIGFLSAYGYKSGDKSARECIYIRPRLSGDGSLELSRQTDGAASDQVGDFEARGEDQSAASLIVLDPIAADREPAKLSERTAPQLIANARLFVEAQATDLSSLINLTKDLKSTDRLLGLFGDLHDHLNSIAAHDSSYRRASTAATTQPRSLLSELFTLCSAVRPARKPLSGPPFEGAAAAAAVMETGTQEDAPGNTHVNGGLLTSLGPSSGKGPRQRRYHNFAAGLNLSWRKILTNLLYLILFLLVRNFLLNYLVRLRTDLQEQARDDFIQLKYSLFEQPSLRQQRDDRYYASLDRRSGRSVDDHSDGLDLAANDGPHKEADHQHAAMDLESMFASLMAEANSNGVHDDNDLDQDEGEGDAGGPVSDYDYDSAIAVADDEEEDEDEDYDPQEEAADELIGNLFAAMLTGRAQGAGGTAPGGLDLAKLMSGLGGEGEAGDLGGLGELLGGRMPANMDVAQLEAMLKDLMSNQAAPAGEPHPATTLEDQSEQVEAATTTTAAPATDDDDDVSRNDKTHANIYPGQLAQPEREAPASSTEMAQGFSDEL